VPRKKLRSLKIGDSKIDVSSIISEMRKIPELFLLTPQQMNEFASDLVDAAGFAAAGYPVDRSDKSGVPEIKKLFLSDVARAMKKQGLKVSSSRLYSGRNAVVAEATVYKVARLLASFNNVPTGNGSVVPLKIPKDPLRLLNSAKCIIYNQ